MNPSLINAEMAEIVVNHISPLNRWIKAQLCNCSDQTCEACEYFRKIEGITAQLRTVIPERR